MLAYRIKDVASPKGPVSRATIYNHAAQGRLTLRKVGGATVIMADDWKRYLEGTPIQQRAA